MSPQAVVSPSVEPVTLTGVSVFYGEVVGLSRVDLALKAGITGIVGPNGSGKTTLMRVLSGLLEPKEGSARVLGRNPFASAEVRARIGFVPATECFYESLSGRRNLEVGFLAQGLLRAEARARARKALEMVGLVRDSGRRYGTWSRGMRQRLKLGLTLASEAHVVLLDEPFLGVDPPTRRQLKGIILELGRTGRTVLVSSHVLHEVESLTDRVGVLAHGRLLGYGRVDSLLRQLRDRHPHRILLLVDDPRTFASALMGLPHVSELRVVGENTLEFVTTRPEVAYRELAELIVRTGILVRRVETLDNTLEAVFRHVTAAGSQRL